MRHPCTYALYLLPFLIMLPFGGETDWARWCLIGVIGLIALFTSSEGLPAELKKPGFLLALIIAWCVFQSLGTGWGHTVWNQSPLPARIALDPQQALQNSLLWGALAGLFWLCYRMPEPHKLLSAVTLACGLQAFIGLVLWGMGAHEIWGVAKHTHLQDATGSFLNRNAFADMVGIGALLAAAQIRSIQRDRWCCFILALCLCALLVSHSRAGMLAMGVSLMWLTAQRVDKRRWVAIACLFLSVLIIIGPAERWLQAGLDDTRRDEVVLLTVKLFWQTPWQGVGLGGFESGFDMIRGHWFGDPIRWTRAHNVFLELLVELGAPAFFALLAVIGLVLRVCRQAPSQLRQQAYMVTLALALHGLVDFTPATPAIAVVWVMILGVVAAHGQPPASKRSLVSSDNSVQT